MSKSLVRLVLAAALLASAGATAATAEPDPPGGSCRIKMGPPAADHNLPIPVGFPGTPYLECYY